MSSLGEFRTATLRVSDFPPDARRALAASGVQIDDTVKVKRGWNVTVPGDKVGVAVGVLDSCGVLLFRIDPQLS